MANIFQEYMAKLQQEHVRYIYLYMKMLNYVNIVWKEIHLMSIFMKFIKHKLISRRTF